MLPRVCNHCDEPPCVPVCPVGATYKRDDGAVVVDADRCVGCACCVQACPYDARFINHETGEADKCTFCLHRVEAGLLPACVETCVGGTKPRVFYIGLDERVHGKVEGEGALWKPHSSRA